MCEVAFMSDPKTHKRLERMLLNKLKKKNIYIYKSSSKGILFNLPFNLVFLSLVKSSLVHNFFGIYVRFFTSVPNKLG